MNSLMRSTQSYVVSTEHLLLKYSSTLGGIVIHHILGPAEVKDASTSPAGPGCPACGKSKLCTGTKYGFLHSTCTYDHIFHKTN